ncbi:YqzK family protein [Virgibacillus xinjiangensis]|uniref:YqzK family protein n=1 Tax=Virgibacillus xinjiangensis TaxID=393090 RepID=A0ABV7CRD8_9BACI
MKRIIWDTCKVFIIFSACTCLFYFGLQMMHAEYENYHRYDPPEGPAVKVFQEEGDFLGRLNLFFRLGE